jgi:bifunctional DNA-binding transcriptional regulator/antitoxin component of YhaV-PrlF toxin-antitoxin module
MDAGRKAESRFVTSRLGANGRTVVPRAVRAALGVRRGDQIGYTIRSGRVILSAITRPPAEDAPFTCFDEWSSLADTEGYASLCASDGGRPLLS